MWPEQNLNKEADRDQPIDFLGVAGSLRFALMFGAGAIALALLIAPFADRQARAIIASGPAGLDRMATGSIGTGRTGSAATYTIRRSVLQSSPSSVCIIRQNGIRNGDC